MKWNPLVSQNYSFIPVWYNSYNYLHLRFPLTNKNRSTHFSYLNRQFLRRYAFHAFVPIDWLADKDSLMCCIVMMGRQIAKMCHTFSLWGSLFLMLTKFLFHIYTPREAFCNWGADDNSMLSFTDQEIGRSHKEPYKAHLFYFSNYIYPITLYNDFDPRLEEHSIHRY